MTHPGVTIRPLAWDTDFFGFPVASLELVSDDKHRLEHGIASLESEGIVLGYWRTNSISSEAAEAARSRNDIFLVEERLTFEKSLIDVHPDQSRSTEIIRYEGREPSVALTRLAHLASKYSRYGVDERFPPRLREGMYDKWLRKLLEGAPDSVVLVHGEANSCNGFVGGTIDRTTETCRLDLIAVSQSMQSKGLGGRLVEAIERWGVECGGKSMQIITQAANSPACRLYSKSGYVVARREYTFHIWKGAAKGSGPVG